MLSMIAMSGGVDSSVAAALTADSRGRDACAGVAMRLYSTPEEAARTGRTCCAPEDLYDARRAAAALGVRFYVYDAQDRFRERVIEPFVAAYGRGETPNPCVRCNDHVKFDWLLDRARELGATELVTGHYARVEVRSGRWRLLRAADGAKDQSYFLHGLTQEALELVRFPLGDLTKLQVRALARERGLPNADKPESMEVCFVGATPLPEFLESHGLAPERGEIVDRQGRVLGAHAGVHRFTVGQRRGIGAGFKLPLYVGEIDASTRRVVVGTREDVQRREFRGRDASWVAATPAAGTRCDVQIRHRGKPLPALLDVSGDQVEVKLLEPAIGVAPGQSAVFYLGDEVLGGATISA
ncbi:MAG TPA: tRNA 2-thiouridine(34) synthase MnmA [Myxococcales bacterium]|nr:tRNA 2-thiouridine(34) synthase MnmA [Myxococcales bacterium]